MIKVEMFPGRTLEQKRALVRSITDAFVSTCGGTEQSVHIVIEEVQKEDWGVGGRLVSDLHSEASKAKS